MKRLYLTIIIFSIVFFLGMEMQPAHSEIGNSIYIQNITMRPSIVKVGDTFTITTILVNNSTLPIWLDGDKCSIYDAQGNFLTVTFDNHAKIKRNDIYCAGVGWGQKLDSGKSITTTSPDYTSTYVATESGTANATLAFSYQVSNHTDPTQPGFSQNLSKSFLFTILDNNTKPQCCGPAYVPPIQDSPLKQFKAGIATHYIKCKEGLHLIIKEEDGTPACVKIETGIKLVNRGWATTFGTGITSEEYDTTCDTPFLASKSDIAVLYMPTNSLGKICLRYSNPNDTPQSIYPPRIFDTSVPTKPPVVRQIWTYFTLKAIPTDNVTIVAWFVKTGNQIGFYGLSLPSCVPTPFAIGYNNNSQMTSKDFPFLGKPTMCDPSSPDIRIDGLTGIGVKYTPYP